MVVDKYRAGDWHRWAVDRKGNSSIVSCVTDECHGDACILDLMNLSSEEECCWRKEELEGQDA